MRHVSRLSRPLGWRAGLLPLGVALVLSCKGEVGDLGPGAQDPIQTPLCDGADPAQVIAPQRIALLTSTQLMNTIRLISDVPAKMIIDMGTFPVITDGTVRFPPPRTEQYKQIQDPETLTPFVNTAQRVGDYVRDNFATVTGCSTATDQCATDYLNKLAIRAYRRQLVGDEQARFTELYGSLKSQIINNYQVTMTVQQATGEAVMALLLSPQVLWRWELGSQTSTSPPGVYLTDAEIASNLSFFLTDRPPDEPLIADARAGTLRANIATHVDRILGTEASRAWLTKVISLYFLLNQLPGVGIDATKFPIVGGGGLYIDLMEESRLFLNDVMWNGKVMDLITSRKAFLNSNLASMVYKVPVPAGATPTNFVETQLNPAERSGILTSAPFVTTRARAEGVGVVPRGLGVNALFLCLETPSPPLNIAGEGGPVEMQKAMLDTMTAQQQVQARVADGRCGVCHKHFDPYGLVLDWYDVIGRFRVTDDLNMPVNGSTVLPETVGGKTVQSAVELAEVLSKRDSFVNCMSKSMLQYALLDVAVEVPAPVSNVPGCAVAGVAHEVRRSSKQSFTDLTRAVATSHAFVLRKQIQ
jgi:hypothetical protein